jgi:hypothetical protein
VSDKKSSFLECLSFDSFLHSCEEISTLLLWGLFYLALLSLLSLAYLPLGDPEHSELLHGDDSLIFSSREHVFMPSNRMAFIATVFALILFFEYLLSHIGEKQPPDDSSGLEILSFARVPLTALFCSAVFYFSKGGLICSE